MKTLRQLGAATRAEWAKFFSLRSLPGLFAAGIVVTLGLGWLLGFSAWASGQNGYDTAMPAPLLVFASLQLGQLFFGAAAILHVTGEYSADQMGTTLQAVPRRGILLTAKAIVLAVLGFAGGVIAILLGTIPTALAARHYGAFELGDLVAAGLGAGTYLGLLSLMVLGLGLLMRNSAGAIVTMLLLVIGLPQIMQLVRIEWIQEFVKFLPTNAATFMATGAVEPYGPVVALVVLFGWAAVLLGGGATRLIRSDA